MNAKSKVKSKKVPVVSVEKLAGWLLKVRNNHELRQTIIRKIKEASC